MPKITKEQLAQIQEYLQSLPEEEREEKLKEVVSQFEEEQEPQCPFCLMSEGKIKTTKVYEDSNFLAVLEINPANPGHTLVFTKRHIKIFSELNEQETEDISKIMKKLTTALSNLTGSMNILVSEGLASGQKFEHLVINIIPRNKNDSVKIGWQPTPMKPEDLEKIKQTIVENFPVEKTKPQPVDEDRLKREFTKLKKRLP